MSEEIRDRIATAIQEADDGFGYEMNLTRLVDGVATYTLRIKGAQTTEHDCTEDVYARVAVERNRRRADAVLAALFAAPAVQGEE